MVIDSIVALCMKSMNEVQQVMLYPKPKVDPGHAPACPASLPDSPHGISGGGKGDSVG
jgi:hypothetical protein